MSFDVPVTTKIDGITWTPKRILGDQRGSVMHFLKPKQADQPIGEIYFSTVKPGVIKGWKLHKEMSQRFIVPIGSVKFVFVDQRAHSKTKGVCIEMTSSIENFGVIEVPSQIYYSFKCVSSFEAMIVNASSIPHTEGECILSSLADFHQYHWE